MKVYTQEELNKALISKDQYIDLCGDKKFILKDSGSSTVTACDSSTVRACGSSTVRAYGSSTVTACDSSTVTACGSSTVRAYGSSTVTAAKFVTVQDHGPNTNIAGGVVVQIPKITTGQQWCEYYDIPIDNNGIAILYKAVQDDWKGQNKNPNITYLPGSIPHAPDFKTNPNCGNGLHLVPRPWMGDQYCTNVAHYVGCPVAVSNMIILDNKVKVPVLAGVTFEVDIDGNRLTPIIEPLTNEINTSEAAYVVVDENYGYVYRYGTKGERFTLDTAKKFAAYRNTNLKVPTYKVNILSQVNEDKTIIPSASIDGGIIDWKTNE